MKNEKKLLNELIKEMKKYKAADLAEWSGYSQTYIKKIINGISCPTLVAAQRIADCFNMEFLLFDKEK